MSSEDGLASTIGLTGYAVDSTGIGGVLKGRVADFRVDEISTKISLDPRGRFTAANNRSYWSASTKSLRANPIWEQMRA